MKPKHGEVKVRGRLGRKEETFPVDVNEVENEALRCSPAHAGWCIYGGAAAEPV